MLLPAVCDCHWLLLSTAFLQTLLKIIFVGDSGVGKTALIERMFSNRFDPRLPATIGE
jgi:GTPase SAR1 family protein